MVDIIVMTADRIIQTTRNNRTGNIYIGISGVAMALSTVLPWLASASLFRITVSTGSDIILPILLIVTGFVLICVAVISVYGVIATLVSVFAIFAIAIECILLVVDHSATFKALKVAAQTSGGLANLGAGFFCVTVGYVMLLIGAMGSCINSITTLKQR